MSAESYSHMSTDALIDEFIRVAKAARSAWTLFPNILKAPPERVALQTELRAIGAELKERKPIEKLRSLLDHESEDVRFFAGPQFLSVDEDWALAAISSLGVDIPTREIVALCARAKRRPPKRPSLKEMSVEQLAARFEDAGMRRYATHFMGNGAEAWDVELSNRIIREMIDITSELKLRNALPALLPLLDHANVCIRNDAAARCLFIAPERAIAVLEAIKAGPDVIEKGDASWTLYRWREKKRDSPAP